MYLLHLCGLPVHAADASVWHRREQRHFRNGAIPAPVSERILSSQE